MKFLGKPIAKPANLLAGFLWGWDENFRGLHISRLMDKYPSSYPPYQPPATGPLKTFHNLQSIYLRIGKEMGELLNNFPFEELRALVIIPTFPPVLYAMVTIFQYAEGVTDQQAAEAVRSRMDWKYALHLPINYTGFDPMQLCAFRVGLRQKKMAQNGLERLTSLLTEMGLLPRKEGEIHALEMVRSVCLLNWLDSLFTALNRAIEVLTFTQPKWLQSTRLSYLTERYPWQAQSGLPITWEKQEILAHLIAEDIFFLLEAIEEEKGTDLSSLVEIINLQKAYRSQFTRNETGLHWFPPEGEYCETSSE